RYAARRNRALAALGATLALLVVLYQLGLPPLMDRWVGLPLALRIAVAIGVAASLALGSFRIVTGTPLYLYMIAGYVIVVVQTIYAPRMIVPLAYDAGGVTTSTVTVPLVAALGLGLASTVPGRSPLLDGFGMIALAALFPMITVMGYAQIGEWMAKRNLRANARNGPSEEGTSP
ncbi:MAG: DUF1538 family protein, partial [Paracoccaceae bacterium]